MGPSEYSLLAAMLTLVLIGTPSAVSLQVAVGNETGWRMEREGEAAVGVVLRDTLAALLRRMSALFFAFLPLGIVAGVVTGVQHPLPVVATLITLAAMLLMSVALGGLEGTGRLSGVSAAQLLFAGLKLCAGVGLTLGGLAAGGVMLGVAGAAVVATVSAAVPLRGIWRRGRSLRSRPRRILRGFAGVPALALTILTALSSMGVLVARVSFGSHLSGGYAAVSFGSYALPIVALTATTFLLRRSGAAVTGHRSQARSTLAVTALGALGTAILFAVPEPLLRWTFGSDYVFAAPWLGPLGIAMTLFAVANLYVRRFLATRRSELIAVLVVVLALECVLFAIFHSSPGSLIGVLIATGLMLVVGCALLEHSLGRRGQLLTGEVGDPFVPLRPIEQIRDLADYGGIVTIVIPAYNEDSRIASTLRSTSATLEEFRCSYEVLVVDDGSADETRAVAERVARELGRIRVVGYDTNAGKGFAVVRGAREARGDLVLFVDADLEVHPRQLQTLYRAMQVADADVVIGSKVHSESDVEYSLKRRLMSWAYYAIVRLSFGLPVRDTQTGLKLFRREVLQVVVPRMLVKRFAFDLEALVIAHGRGFRVVETPVVVTRERDLQNIGWLDALHTAWDTVAVWYRAYLRRYYDEIRLGSARREASPDTRQRG